MSRRSENCEAVEFFYGQLCSNFGPASADAIMEIFIYTLGGMRITVPTLKALDRRERNRKIRRKFKGDYKELMQPFNLTEGQIRRIVNNKSKDGGWFE